MNVRYTKRATRDLASILSYIAERSPSGAAHVSASLQNGVRLIASHPRRWPRTGRPNLFVKILTDYPYNIFYRVRGESVEIVHIRHTSRKPLYP